MKRAVAAALIGLASLIGAQSAQADQAGAILSAINAERSGAGIGALSTRGDWNSACAQHTAYMAANRTLTHDQTPGDTLFSTSGDWAASRSVLAWDSRGFTSNPWISAPLHQFQAMHPWLTQTGIDVSNNYACMITLEGQNAPNRPTGEIVTVPGSGQAIRASEVARESPFVPGSEIGLPEGTETGPHIYVYALGPQRFKKVVVNSASVTGSDGVSVPVRWVDADSSRSGDYLTGGAIVVPTSPLRVGVMHSLHVALTATSESGLTYKMSRTSSFYAGTDALPASPHGAHAAAETVVQRGGRKSKRRPRLSWTLVSGSAPLRVSLAWNRTGLRARIVCASVTVRCTGPVRVLVKRRGGKLQRLRFVHRRGALGLSLAPGQKVIKRVKLTRKQRRSGNARGFAVRWRANAPVPVFAPQRKR